MSAPAPALQTPPTRRFCNISCVLPIFAEMGRAFAWKDSPHMSSYVGGTRALPPVLSPGGSYPRSLSPGMIPPAMIESRGMPETRRFLHARAGPRSGPSTKANPSWLPRQGKSML